LAEQTKLPLGKALKHGFGLAWSSPGVVALGILTEAASALLSAGLQLALLMLFFRQALYEFLRAVTPLLDIRLDANTPELADVTDWLIPLVAAGLTSVLIVLALRALWMGALVGRFSNRLMSAPDDSAANAKQPVLALGSANFLRVVLVGLLFVPIFLTGGLFNATLLGSSGLLFIEAIQAQSLSPVAVALLVALALVLALFVGKGIDLLFRATLVRAVAANQGPIDAVVGALRLLWARAGSFVGILVVFSVLQSIVLGAMSGAGAALHALPESMRAAVLVVAGLILISAVASALVIAFLTTAEYGSYTAIDLDARGALPRPPPPPPAPESESESEPVPESEPQPVPNTQPMPPPAPELSSAEEGSDLLDARVTEEGPRQEQQAPIVETRLASEADTDKAPEGSVAEDRIVETRLVHDGAEPELFDPDSVSITLADEATSELSSQEFEAIQEP
jgi:hypothetical protein